MIDPQLFTRIGSSTLSPLTLTPDGDAIGDVAFLTEVGAYRYAPGAAVGEAFKFSVDFAGNDRVARGEILANEDTDTGASLAGSQLGAVSATQKVYAALHVFSVVSAPAAVITVESDDNSDFTSATTRITFTTVTAATSEFLSLAGAITDDWWRCSFTVDGVGNEVEFLLSVGIV
ncbi:MAG: hypothetical protein Q8R92_17590 [Deltaproteobacteria bacterium]|nr:hypothetical protein [Deltaproteobacteria bacterium]